MVQPSPISLRRSDAWIWASVLIAVAVVAALGSVIGFYDVQRAVADRRDEELRRLQFNAERSVAQIQIQLADESTSTEGGPPRLESVRTARWLRSYWARNFARQPERLYSAVTDRSGKIVAHSVPEREGQQIELPPDSDAQTESTLVETIDNVLTAGLRSLDMRVPILVGGQPLGTYHAGLDADWLDARLREERFGRARFWCILVGGTCALILLSSVVVVRVTRHTERLEHELEAAHTRRVSEMHELVLGIAHEIRNPLNAIRLNLHTLGQVFRDEAPLDDDEVATMLDEMSDEIERLETLMREMLGFARTRRDETAATDVVDEIQRTISFLRANLDRQKIHVRVGLPEAPCAVAMDATRLRQVLLNLLNNAIEALRDGGSIDISARVQRGQIEIVVADDGPGIRPEDRERVFVPFYSTKASGTGLGLALARKFVEEAGGAITCEESPGRGGSRFRLVLPVRNAAAVEAAI